MLAGDEVVDHAALEGAGTVKRVQSHQVFEAGRLVAAQDFPHAVRLELEDATGGAAGKQLEGFGVIQRQVFQHQLHPAVLLNQLDGVRNHGQGGQAQEVHLEQADPLQVVHGELGDDFVLVGLVERNHFPQRLGRDDHAGGVGGGVAREPFQAAGYVQHLLDLRFAFVALPQGSRLAQGLVNRDVQLRRHHLGQAVGLGVGQLQGAGGVLHRRLGGQRSEGDDLGHVLPSVGLGDVVDHLAPAAHAEINVNVGQRDALRVQEALEQQPVVQRINVGDAQGVAHQAAGGRTAARPHRDALLARVANEVPHDQEVAGKAHLLDHADFFLQPALVVRQRVPQQAALRLRRQARPPLLKPLPGHLFEVTLQGKAVGDGKVREGILLARQRQVAALGDFQRPLHRLRHRPKHLQHLLGALEVELVGVELHPVGIADQLAHLDAEQDVVRVRVPFGQVVAIIGGDQRDAGLLRHPQQVGLDAMLLFQALVLDFQIEIPRAQDVAVLARGPARRLIVVGEQVERHLAIQAGGKSDQAPAVLRQQLLVNAGLVVEPFQVAGADQLDQVAIALQVLAQQNQVVGVFAVARAAAAVAGGDVHLTADDGLDAVGFGGLAELGRPEEVAVVGHRYRRHPLPGGQLSQARNGAGAVQQTVVGVEMKVDKLCF